MKWAEEFLLCLNWPAFGVSSASLNEIGNHQQSGARRGKDSATAEMRIAVGRLSHCNESATRWPWSTPSCVLAGSPMLGHFRPISELGRYHEPGSLFLFVRTLPHVTCDGPS